MKNKVAIITGASRGIGRSIALNLANNNYSVAVVARSAEELGQVEAEINKIGGSVISIVADISEECGSTKVVGEVMNHFGRVDLLVNNAGIGTFKPATEITASEWEKVMNVNVKGTFLLSKEAVIAMKKQGSGHIITIASDVSKRTFETGSLYCASKYAQDAFCTALRKEVRQFGIKVSVVYPGLVDTYFHGGFPGEEANKNWLKPDDISEAVLYIAQAPKHVVIDELMIHPFEQEY